MSTVTIEEVKATQEKLAAMFAELVRNATTTFNVPAAAIELRSGERYAGLVLAADGTPSHHLVLLPGEAESVNWTDATDWAAKAGGELPSRQEQALLFANLKPEFQPTWYWSNQAHESEGSFAWFQYFGGGGQRASHKSYEGRARAVRRFAA
jgi:hypothetical protein